MSDAETPKRVLVVEDNLDDLRLIERVADQMPVPIELVHVIDGREALTLTEAWAPLEGVFDMVLLDSKVPGADGLQILQALRESDPLSKVPIVLLIGASGDDFSDSAMGHGADACIVKPIMPQQFMEKVRRIFLNWLELEDAPAAG